MYTPQKIDVEHHGTTKNARLEDDVNSNVNLVGEFSSSFDTLSPLSVDSIGFERLATHPTRNERTRLFKVSPNISADNFEPKVPAGWSFQRGSLVGNSLKQMPLICPP